MKLTAKKSLFMTVALIVAVIISSCDNNPDETNNVTVFLNHTEIEYDATGVWTGTYNETSKIISQGVEFSHSANSAYKSWTGFVASRNNDVNDYSTGNWLEHQFTVINGGGLSGESTPYFVAYWNSSENIENATSSETPSVLIKTADGKSFTPISVFVNNTTYAYYAMLNGSAYNKKFVKGDYLKLLAYGIDINGNVTEPQEIYLAKYDGINNAPIKDWTYFNLEALGKVKAVFFRMESSDKGKWGMNTPAYFAIDRMSIHLE